MGLNRELREINRQILTDKQERQAERLQRKQEKELLNDIKNYIDYHIINYLNKSFLVYSSKLYNFELINELKQSCINEGFLYSDKDFIMLNFDNIYYKELNKIIKRYKLNQQAQAKPPATTPENTAKFHPIQDFFLFWLAVFGLIDALTGSVKKRR